MYLKVNKSYSSFNDSLAKNEKNDCVVRSIASACNVSYRTAHTFCKEKFNRVDKRGTNNMNIVTQMLKWETTGIEIGEKKLSVRQTENLVSLLRKGKKQNYRSKDSDTLATENDLADKIGMRVILSNKKNNSGKIIIEYKDLDQFELVSDLLTKN